MIADLHLEVDAARTTSGGIYRRFERRRDVDVILVDEAHLIGARRDHYRVMPVGACACEARVTGRGARARVRLDLDPFERRVGHSCDRARDDVAGLQLHGWHRNIRRDHSHARGGIQVESEMAGPGAGVVAA